jgi:hypothetical protein
LVRFDRSGDGGLAESPTEAQNRSERRVVPAWKTGLGRAARVSRRVPRSCSLPDV